MAKPRTMGGSGQARASPPAARPPSTKHPRPPGRATSAQSGRSRAPRASLTPERILAAAVALVEAGGMPALTTRRLATALGCQAMSVYHHFPSKQHLLDAVVEHAIAGIPEPAVTADPIDTIAFLAREYRTTAHRHPRLFQAIALYRLDLPAGVAFVERMLRHFHAAIPDDRLAAQAFRVFACYVTGAVRDETSGCAAGPSAAAPVSDEFIARECPRLAAAAPYLEAANGNAAFELGLAMVLKGLAELRASVLARSRPAPKPVIRLKA